MMKISGRLRQTSTQSPAGMLSSFEPEIRSSASISPKISESTIPITAISRLTRKPSIRKRKLLPDHTHSQLSGSKR
jgi:hypothetical protein